MLILLILLVVCRSANHSVLNDTVRLNGFLVRNNALFAINAPPSRPYQTIEDVSSDSFKGYFDFTHNSSTYVTAFIEFSSSKMLQQLLRLGYALIAMKLTLAKSTLQWETRVR